MDVEHKAIATMYHGVMYRSRLEARWAAFFDLMGWPYQYEPYDLHGWIPDFLLMTAIPLLVEVKPVIEFPKDVADRIDRAYPRCPNDCRRSSVDDEENARRYFEREVLIVGCSFVTSDDLWDDRPCIGWLREEWWEEAVFGRWTGDPDKGSPKWSGRRPVGFCPVMQTWVDRVTGRYDGKCHGGQICNPGDVWMPWNKAGNAVQWRGPLAEPRRPVTFSFTIPAPATGKQPGGGKV